MQFTCSGIVLMNKLDSDFTGVFKHSASASASRRNAQVFPLRVNIDLHSMFGQVMS